MLYKKQVVVVVDDVFLLVCILVVLALLLLFRSESLPALEDMLKVIILQFRSKSVESRVAALNWVRVLYAKTSEGICCFCCRC